MDFSDDAVNQTRELLSKHPFFSQAKVCDLNEMIAFGSLESIKDQEIIIKKGAPINSFYLILEGEAGIYYHETIRPKQLLMTLEPGAHFGLMGPVFFVHTYEQSLSVIAHSPMIIWHITLHQLQEFLSQTTAAADFKMKLLAELSPYSFITNWAPFSHIKSEHQDSIGKHFDVVYCSQGDTIFSCGEPAQYCYFIIFGSIALTSSESELLQLGTRDYFGEDCLLSSQPRDCTATAVTPCLLLRLPLTDFLSWVKHDKQMAQAVFKTQIHQGRPSHAPGTVIIEPVNPSKEKWRLLKNDHTQQYFQLSEQGWYVWSQINGTNTLRDLIVSMYHDLQIFDPDYIYQLLISLKLGGYINLPTTVDAFSNDQLPRWKKSLLAFSKIMQSSYVFKENDRWLSRSYNAFIKYFYSPLSLMIILLLAVLGCLSFIFSAPTTLKIITQGNVLLYLLYILPFTFVTLIIHELAHAFTAKHFGRAVQHIGLGWFWLGPVAFVDTSDMWAATNKQRVFVNSAGIFIELVIAGLVALFSLGVENTTLLGSMWFFCFSTYIGVFSNLCPLFEYDGYYIIMDILKKPNLRAESVSWLTKTCANPKQVSFKAHRAEIIYCLYSLSYVVVSIILTILIQASIVQEFFPTWGSNTLVWLIPVVLLVLSVIAVFIKQKHLNDLKHYD